jgi:CRP-like cAMP-binding protein
MTSFSRFLLAVHPVSDAILDEYISNWEEVQFHRRDIITAAGDVERYLYFVLEGFQKSYYIRDGKQHVMAFSYAPSFSGVPDSFFSRKASVYFLEAITPSRMLRIHHDVHLEMLERYMELNTLFRKATEHVLVGFVQRHLELLTEDIETRFRHMLTRSPHLLNAVSHKDIASYLGIDATNFSRLLGKVKI